MALAPTAARPPRRSSNPLGRVVADLVDEARARGGFPPGPSRGGVARAKLIAHDPLAVLLPLYEEYGPIFSVRLLHSRVVFMLGPEANHYVTVSHPQNFLWREGSFGDLIPLLGDGLLTIDGGYHDRTRRIMMPAFHREQIEASVAVMAAEADRGARAAAPGRGRRRLRLGPQPGDADRDARPARPRPRRRRSRRRGGAPLRGARSPTTGPSSTCGCCAAPGSPWRRLPGLAPGARRDRLRRDRRPPPRSRPGAPRPAQPADHGHRRGRLEPLRRGGPRPGDDADVRRPRHLDLHPLLPLPRARRPPRGARPAAGRGRRGARRRDPDRGAAVRRAALPRHGRRRDPAPLPAGLDRAAPGGARVRVRRPPRARPAPTSTTARGPATGCPRSSPSRRRSSPSASPASARRRSPGAPTCPSAAARGSASASASARPR